MTPHQVLVPCAKRRHVCVTELKREMVALRKLLCAEQRFPRRGELWGEPSVLHSHALAGPRLSHVDQGCQEGPPQRSI